MLLNKNAVGKMHELSRSDHLRWVDPSRITFLQLFISAQSTEVWFMMPYLSYSRVECACEDLTSVGKFLCRKAAASCWLFTLLAPPRSFSLVLVPQVKRL